MDPRNQRSKPDSHYMRRALALARRGMPSVSPNPMVGAVLVRGGRLVGQGFHERAGGPHAEVRAILNAGREARGATLYVTLEPCNHFGKAPPCVHAILEAGISRVVIACRDPHPAAAGGAEALKASGIAVELGCEESRAKALIAPWLHRVRTGRSFCCAALGRSLDGRFYGQAENWQMLLGPPARRHLARLGRTLAAEGELRYPSTQEIRSFEFLRGIGRLYVYGIPQFLGSAGESVTQVRHSSLPAFRLDCTQRLGQVVLSEYAVSASFE